MPTSQGILKLDNRTQSTMATHKKTGPDNQDSSFEGIMAVLSIQEYSIKVNLLISMCRAVAKCLTCGLCGSQQSCAKSLLCAFCFLSPILLGALLILSYQTMLKTLPDYNATFETTLLNGTVKIGREESGIPHIQAETLEEAYFGLGFVHAQDRLWQMELRRLISQGRMQEFIGPMAYDLDQTIRGVGYLESARRIAQNYDPYTKRLLQAYADGINFYARKPGFVAPIEFQVSFFEFKPWTIYDTVTVMKLLALQNLPDQKYELIRSRFEDLYGRKIAMVLGAVGPQNQFEAQQTVLAESELQSHTGFWVPSNASDKDRARFVPKEPKTRFDSIFKGQKYYHQTEYWLPRSAGSNAWVISGKHTKSGKPHLANDPHLDNTSPSPWYQAELRFSESGEENFIIGGTLPGVPIVLSGRSKHFGWGLTTLYSDGGDLFEEEIKAEGEGYQYLVDGQWRPARVVKEPTNSRFFGEQNFTFIHTHRGPVIEKMFLGGSVTALPKNKFYSFQSVVQVDDVDNILAFVKFQTGRNFLVDIQWLRNISYPNSGMVFMSKDNHIAYLSSGKLVVKNLDPDADAFPKKGQSSEQDWAGYVSQAQQPLIVDPEKGYFVCANNKFMPDNNKLRLSWNTQPTARGKRLNALISELVGRGKITVEDHMRLQGDRVDSYVQSVLPHLLKMLGEHKRRGNETNIQRAIELLQGWNGSFSPEESGAVLYGFFENIYVNTFARKLEKRVREDWQNSYMFDSFYFKNLVDLSVAKPGAEVLSADYCEGTGESKCLWNVVDSMDAAFTKARERFGEDPRAWKWGEVHEQVFSYSPFFGFLDLKLRGVGGNGRTPSVSAYKYDGEFKGETGANYRMIISMDEEEASWYVVDTGVSEHQMSQRRTDQMELWRENKYVRMRFGGGEKYEYETVIVGRRAGSEKGSERGRVEEKDRAQDL